MRTKPGLTVERTEAIEQELQAMRNRLVTLCVEVLNAYPNHGPGARAARYLEKAQQAIDNARWLLEGW